ncbi:F0F1 ATP synthase subunit gamma [Beijerinckia indica]|uniref:H+transporting two-sector ATPase gamma subunit n=1 Tax=Beijerinckia indica subsp. indica (strain ATCC 9039 / DSM 1715 / NCIMB 8712) TaxID=395963 RepID=B2IJX7_BEII9|nr:FoF1 ATP synthase subunit gamma [Beijerinckia indica]ACB96352.1 H+transporting two-sector ATPase gamma subunit [Beijerinckia indica subsp. indica ATCC 9039]
MTERLSDVAARIHSVRQLSAVITAMRGIAASRSREARSQLDGVRAYAQTIAEAIGHALAFLPERPQTEPAGRAAQGHGIIALCAEQGFAGTFNERVLDAAGRLISAAPDRRTALLLVGDRGLMVARERGLAIAWSAPMAAHAGQAASLANQIVEELYRRIDGDHMTRISIVHAVPGPSAAVNIAEKVLVPFDFGRFPLAHGAVHPLITLPPDILLARLAEEYIFAELCEAVMLSFAAENEARMRAMIAAKTNVAKTLDGLIARSRQLRQEEITNEILELDSGASSSGQSPR